MASKASSEQEAAHAKAKAEAHAKAKAEADAKAKAEADAKAKVEADTKAKAEADAKAKVEADAKEKADAEPVLTPFPLEAMKQGMCVARVSWAPGYTIKLGMKGNRGKSERCFFQTGSRSGEIPWKPLGIADLLAEDWIVIA